MFQGGRKRARREEVGGLGVVWGKEGWEYCQDRSACHILKEGYIGASLLAQTVKSLPAKQEIPIRSLGWEDSPGEGNGYPLQCSCLENSMDRGAWRATVHGVAKSGTRLSDQHSQVLYTDNESTINSQTEPEFVACEILADGVTSDLLGVAQRVDGLRWRLQSIEALRR